IKATTKLHKMAQKYFSDIGMSKGREQPFDFAEKLAELPKITSQIAEPAKADERTFDGSWCFQLETRTPLVEQWANDFAQRMEQRWKVRLAPESSTSRKVLLRITPDNNAPRESHRIHLQD